MNLYQLKHINNHLDHRLVDLFARQNQENSWLTLMQCASWVFETNKPNRYHQSYTQRKLTSLVGAMATRERVTSPFDMKYAPSEVGEFVYRLKDASLIKRVSCVDVREQINSAYSEPAMTSVHQSEECCDDLYDF